MIVRLVAGSLIILLTWTVLAAALGGVGLLVRRTVRLPITTGFLLASFWLGLALVTTFLHLWHFLLPVNPAALLIVLGVGGLGLLRDRRELLAHFRAVVRPGHLPYLLVVAGLALWAANRALGPVTMGDSGMYHLPAVTWSKSYAIVPGLANLHGRFGFNNSHLLFAALVDQGFWAGRSAHIVSGLFLVALQVQALYGGWRLWRVGANGPDAVFDFLLLAPLVLLMMDSHFMSSMSTDTPTVVTALVAVSLLFRVLVRPEEERSAGRDGFELGLAVVLFVLAVTFKLSAAVFAGLGVVTALGWGWSRFRREARVAWPILAGAGAVGLVLGATWLARGVLLSGYPLYPETLAAAPVAWRVPAEQAEAEGAWITHYGRTYYSGVAYNTTPLEVTAPGHWGWVKPWFRASLARADARWSLFVPLALSGGLLCLGLARRGPGLPGAGWLLLVPVLGAALFWFVSAPRPQFGFFTFWAMAGVSAGFALTRFRPGRAVRRGVVVAGFGLGALPAVLPALGLHGDLRGRTSAAFGERLLVPPGPDHGWFHPVPEGEFREFTTSAGLRLLVPVRDNRCWNGPPLCTPHPAPNLMLREAENPAAGFQVKGAWNPDRWPSPGTTFLTHWRAYVGRPR